MKHKDWLTQCTCKIGYGWIDYKCIKCGKDIRGVWYVTTYAEERRWDKCKTNN